MVNAQELENEFGITPELSVNLEHFFNNTMDLCKKLRKQIEEEMNYVERDVKFITPIKALEEMRILSQFDASLSCIMGCLEHD